MDQGNEQTRASWDEGSDAYYQKQYEHTDALATLKEDPWRAFPTEIARMLKESFPSLKGTRVCVPSSGDNAAAFAFHLLGACVTSCDLSSGQIKNARAIAHREGWDMQFHVADSMALSGVESGAYDLVYTSNGVHVWIPQLQAMYGAFHRVLKSGGRYIFFETHPFIRPFDDSTNELRVIKPYDHTGPLGSPPNYLWRVCDFVNALTASGLTVLSMGELRAEKAAIGCTWWALDEWDQKADWHLNPYAALPQWVSLCAVKTA